jgi:hypothetical protein
MRYMNDWDLDQARRRYGRGETPNRLALVMVVDNLRQWANENSDGWVYWPKPCRAASKAIELIESTAYPEYERRQHEDITDAEMLAAVRPIKSFLTRAPQYGARVTPEDREIILRAVTS